MKKKFLFFKVFVLLLLSTTLLPSQNIYKISVQNDMLAFEKTQDYYKVIRDFNKEQKEEFVQFLLSEMIFNKLSKYPESNLYKELHDDFIELILNQNGYVQIGDYVYKVDLINQKAVVVLASNYLSLQKELDANIYNNDLIRAYNLDDEVIGMVETNTPPSNSKLFCGQSGVGADKKENQVNLNVPGTSTSCNYMYGKVQYVQAGIYFHLKAEANNYCGNRRMYWHKTPAAYVVKCGYTYGPVYQWDISSGHDGGASNAWSQTFYLNVQPLHAFWLRVVFMAKDKNWIGNPDNPSVDLEIRKNM